MWFGGFGGGSSDDGSDDGFFADDGFFSFASDGPTTSRSRYSTYARKSSAAERRENQGRSKFSTIQNDVEEAGVASGNPRTTPTAGRTAPMKMNLFAAPRSPPCPPLRSRLGTPAAPYSR